MCSIRPSPTGGGVAGDAAQPASSAATKATAKEGRMACVFIDPRRSIQRHARTHDARLLVSRDQLDTLAPLRADDPFDLDPVVGEVVVGPEGDARVLVRLAL